MYNVEKLEQQWIRYRRKKLIFPAVAMAVGVAAVSALIYFVTLEKSRADTNTTVATAQEGISGVQAAVKESTEKRTSPGKLDILATEVPSLSPSGTDARPKAGQIIFQDDSSRIAKKVKKKKNLLIQVTERGGKDIAVDIENRFEFAKDKSDSLFLAKYYYDKMEYPKAEKWALETNKLDSTIEEGWLIFAKALAKQGKRIESLKVLKAYLDQGGSVKARQLMDKIRRGKSF